MTPYLDISLNRFTPVFKNTQITAYIETSRRMADYFIDNLPSDGVVPWYVFDTVLPSSVCLTRPPGRDFNAPLVPPRPADSSAAMIAANGMLLLAQQEHTIHNFTGSAYYTASAIKVRFSLLVPSHFPLTILPVAPAGHQRQHEARVGADVAEPALERDGQQPSAEQPDRDRVRCVVILFSGHDCPFDVIGLSGDYYFIKAGNELVSRGLASC